MSKKCQISFISEIANSSTPGFIFNDFYYFDRISSTQDFAFKIIKRKKKIRPSVIICNIQSSGKGRKGYLWSSPKGGIWVSVFLETALNLEDLFFFAMVSAICICETIEKKTNLKPKVKWPNDIFVNGKKLAGILLDVQPTTDKCKNKIIIGMGINTNNDLNLTKSKIQKEHQCYYQITTLKDEVSDPTFSNVHILSSLLNNLSLYLSKIDHDDFVKELVQKNYQQRIMESKNHLNYSFNVDDMEFDGEIVDVDADGSLLVKDIRQQKIISISSANSVNLK
ncbi:MAG: biotin--[acetyl-CoA-carboxylase] ligase [Nitrosopumilus sp.]|nr:biotin--[acetyl-CoA-carboxylase] ligase [Nitrosopumilus sp.]